MSIAIESSDELEQLRARLRKMSDVEERRNLEIAADEFGVARVQVRDEEKSHPKDDESDIAVGAVEAPSVEKADFGDADEQQAEPGEAKAAFSDGEREEEGDDGFDAPADGDAPEGDFIEDQQGDEEHREEKIDLLGAGEQGGEAEVEFGIGRGLGSRGDAFAQRKGEGLRSEENGGDGGDEEDGRVVAGSRGAAAVFELEGDCADESEEGDKDAVVEEEVERREPGHADEQERESGPGDED